MFFVIATICFGFITGVASGPPDYSLEFPVKGVTDYVNIWGMRNLTQFTVCFWMNSTSSSGTPFSYATRAAINDLLIDFAQGNFYITIGDTSIDTGVKANDGKLHPICVTWRNSDGEWNLYKDGKLAKEGTDLKTQYTIQAGGSLVLGQEQDNVGGGFDANQSLLGTLINVNVWSYVLPPSTIKEMSKCCLAGKGDVYGWADFIYGIKGYPRLVMPAGCSCCF